MDELVNLEERRPIWIALSEFYLDSELQESDFNRIANTILASPYSLAEVKRINKYEVFPILQINILSMAGEWAGFDETWLIETITSNLKDRTVLSYCLLNFFYLLFAWMCNDYWKKLETAYSSIQNNKSI